MRYPKHLILLFAVIIIFSVSSDFTGTGTGNILTNETKVSLLSDTRISVTSDAGFAPAGFTGSGTPGDPYVLSGANITIDNLPCISIFNTRAHFVIEYSLFAGTPADTTGVGIWFNNVSNGIVSNCDFLNRDFAIYSQDSDNITIGDNYFSDVNYGCNLQSSTNFTISSNILEDTEIKALDTDSFSGDLVFSNNTISGQTCDLTLLYAVDVEGAPSLISNNTFSDITGSAILVDCDGRVEIIDNRIKDADGFGIYVDSDDALVENNTVSCVTTYDGIYLDFSDNAVVHNNTVRLCNGTGIHNSAGDDGYYTNNTISSCNTTGLWMNAGAWRNKIYYNKLGWNRQNARDDGSSSHPNYNVWHNTSTDTGNSYNNYTAPGAMAIPGSGARYDFYPSTLNDSVAPVISSPSDLEFIAGETGYSITWLFSDAFPYGWALYNNSALQEEDYWCCGNLTLSLDGSAPGFYNFTLMAQDAAGNVENDTVYVTVIEDDNDPPTIVGPDDFNSEAQASDVYIEWNATDANPDMYLVFRNETQQGIVKSWTSEENISYWIGYMDPGLYNYTVLANDTFGNEETDTVWVTVADTAPPIVVGPSDFEYEWGDSGNWIEWTTYEYSNDTFIVFRNGTEISSGTYESKWDGIPGHSAIKGNVTINIDGLDIGVYNFTVIIFDESGNNATDTVLVDILDTTQPELTGPGDIEYEIGTEGAWANWTFDESNPDYRELYINGTLDSTVNHGPDWLSILLDLDTTGSHNFTMILYDESGNNDTDTIWVTTSDTIAPTIDSPIDETLELGGDESITWTLSSFDSWDYPGVYWVYRNESMVDDTGVWDSGGTITIETSELFIGTYNFTVMAFDASNNNVSDGLWVTIEDTTLPSINSPDDMEIDEGDIGEVIPWEGSDLDSAFYEVLRNGTTILSGEWSGTYFHIPLDGLSSGVYNYTLVLTDGSGNIASDTVFVTVLSETTTTTTTTTTTSTTTTETSTTETTTETSTTTSTTDTTTPPAGESMTIILVTGGIVGAVVVIAIIMYMKKSSGN